jgi:large conductance mechanosensitive channel
MKKFFSEFKKFITRGNIVDMAVGVIVGSSFTAIVTALTQKILMPLVNWLIAFVTGGNGMEGAITILERVEVDGVLDLTQSIYIDWGAFITAIINFILIAIILFLIVKTINGLRELGKPNLFGYSKAEYKALMKAGKTRAEIKALAEQRDAEAAAKKAEEEAAAAAKAAEPSSTDKLLMEILETLKKDRA